MTTTSIQSFYSGRTVMVTGGTGFMGKVLLEKMIRSLTGVKKIYVIVREKKGLTPEQRLALMTDKMPFTHDKVVPGTIEKLVCIHGDVTLENLGLSERDKRTIVDEVSVVFHLAASIRMNMSLKEAIVQNTIGTRNVLNLCTEISNLASVIHLSTAYCNVDQVADMEEKVYQSTVDPYDVIDLVRWMKDDDLKKIENSLISPHPNTYTFSKRLAEVIADDMGGRLPVSIGRPSIVSPGLVEPIPGWIDTLIGPCGFLVAGGKGVLKSMLGDKTLRPEVIPVDGAINGLILMAYVRATRRFDNTPVYNLTLGDSFKYNWGDIMDSFRKQSLRYPFRKKMWYTTGYLTTNRLVHYSTIAFWHVFVAYLVDTLMVLFLQKPFLVNIQDRLSQGMKVLTYFVTRQFTFKNERCRTLEDAVGPEDVKEFTVVTKDFDLDKYTYNSYTVTKKYILDEETVESENRVRRLEVTALRLLDIFCKCVIVYAAAAFVVNLFGGIW